MSEEEIKFDKEYMSQKFGTDHFKYMVDYANKRVIEELEEQLENYFNQEVETYLSDNLKNRIKELKQD